MNFLVSCFDGENIAAQLHQQKGLTVRMNRKISTVFAVCALMLISTASQAFGVIGHRVVARIAEENLTPSAKKAIMAITKGHPLASLATWPDEIRSYKYWAYTKPWHYLSIDDNESFNNFPRSKKGDVLEALDRFEAKLRNPSVKGRERWQALAFYVHFIGDIHQPLHVGRRDDRGGNNIKVRWFGKESNLHRVWDSGLIERQKLSFKKYADHLNHASDEEKAKWQQATYLDYAKESKAMRNQVYDFGDEHGKIPNLGNAYESKMTPLINQRLLKAGIRLAGKLNSIFAAPKKHEVHK